MISRTPFFLIVLFSHSVFSQTKFSLNQCIDFAFKQNLDFKQTELKLKQSENTLAQSRKAIYPTLSGSFSQGLNSGRSIDPFSNDFVQNVISSNSLNLGGSITLFNGFTLKNQIVQNTFNTQADQWEIQRNRKELSIRITLAYMQILMYQELWKTANEQVKNIENQLLRTKELVKEGMIPQTNIIDIEAQLSTARFDVLNNKNTITTSKITLAQLMGYSNFMNFDIEQMVQNEELLFDDNYLQMLLQNINTQPIIRNNELKVQSSKTSVKIAQANKYPTITLNAGLGSAYSSAAAKEFRYFNQLGFNFNQFARLSINIPIFNNGQIASRISQANILQQMAETQLLQTKFQLKQEIEQAYLVAKMAEEKLQSAKFQVNAQQISLDSAKERFLSGIIHAIELQTFRMNLDKAKSNLIQSKYEYHFRRLILTYYQN